MLWYRVAIEKLCGGCLMTASGMKAIAIIMFVPFAIAIPLIVGMRGTEAVNWDKLLEIMAFYVTIFGLCLLRYIWKSERE